MYQGFPTNHHQEACRGAYVRERITRWICGCLLHPEEILIEAEGVPFDVAREALRLAAQKLPITTKFIVRTISIQE